MQTRKCYPVYKTAYKKHIFGFELTIKSFEKTMYGIKRRQFQKNALSAQVYSSVNKIAIS